MKPKVYLARPVSKEVEAYIGKHCDYRKWEGKGKIPQDVLMKELKDAEGVLVQNASVTNELLEQAPKLKVISNSAVGYDSFDLEAMKQHGYSARIRHSCWMKQWRIWLSAWCLPRQDGCRS